MPLNKLRIIAYEGMLMLLYFIILTGIYRVAGKHQNIEPHQEHKKH